ncbi:MAG TPA: hypothetical protein VGH92_01390 [Gaiellaceae bacterium]
MTGPRIAVAGLVVLAAGCGSSVVTTTSTTRQASARAFSHCMRTHGVPNFPDPNPQGDFQQFHLGVSKATASAANVACKHLLTSGGTGSPQDQRQKFTFALKVAACLRAHGYPDFPDPTSSGQSVPPGIDTQSPQFQTVETSCEARARKALGLP